VLAAAVLTEESLHVRAIADRASVPYSVAQREIDRLENAGLVTSSRFGSARVVRANDSHPLFPELRSLLLKTYGPREVVAEVLEPEPGVEAAYLFGSWAARYEGDWGPPPADVDVLVVGTVPLSRLEELEAQAEDRLRTPVQLTRVKPSDWAASATPFVRTVRRRPLVPVIERGA
jgi:predicted nucleotidyltransferase